jgi:hypothetical protein
MHALKSSAVALFCLAATLSPQSTPPPTGARGALFDHLVGRWVLRGTIDNHQTTHDVDAEYVLNRGYVRLHEVSREKGANGAPAYEAIVFISQDKKTGEYSCLWLDNTSNAGLSGNGIGHGKPTGNSIPFLIASAPGKAFHTTFIYVPDQDAWKWEMDDESGGKLEPFARVTLARR